MLQLRIIPRYSVPGTKAERKLDRDVPDNISANDACFEAHLATSRPLSPAVSDDMLSSKNANELIGRADARCMSIAATRGSPMLPKYPNSCLSFTASLSQQNLIIFAHSFESSHMNLPDSKSFNHTVRVRLREQHNIDGGPPDPRVKLLPIEKIVIGLLVDIARIKIGDVLPRPVAERVRILIP